MHVDTPRSKEMFKEFHVILVVVRIILLALSKHTTHVELPHVVPSMLSGYSLCRGGPSEKLC